MIEDMIAIGEKAIHPIDPTSIDIEELKHTSKTDLPFFGNISNELLENGSPREIADLTRMRIRKLAPGGGYCLGSGNSQYLIGPKSIIIVR